MKFFSVVVVFGLFGISDINLYKSHRVITMLESVK